jgi:hypothetical protein
MEREPVIVGAESVDWDLHLAVHGAMATLIEATGRIGGRFTVTSSARRQGLLGGRAHTCFNSYVHRHLELLGVLKIRAKRICRSACSTVE